MPEGRWKSWLSAKAPVLLFSVKFGGLILLLYALLSLPFFEQMLYVYLKANAWISNAVLLALGQGTHVSEVTIASANFAIAVRRGCDAVEPTWLLCAAILAFPSLFVRKLVGISIGIISLQLLNMVRIVTLFLIGLHFPALFATAHLEIWPMIFILIAITLFVGWRGWACAR
jgi:exosortase/archaeosortase family protein